MSNLPPVPDAVRLAGNFADEETSHAQQAAAAPIAADAPPTLDPNVPVRGFSGGTPGMIAMVNPDGSVDQVRIEDARAAIEAGSRPASSAEAMSFRGSTMDKIGAGAFGGLRGLTAGFSDPAAVAIARGLGGEEAGHQMSRDLRDLKEAFPGISTGTEIAGSLAPLLLSGGASAPEQLEGGLLARAGQRALLAAPRAAVEGAVYGAGAQASEDALGDHEANASKYVNSIINGGFLGVLMGSTLHAGIGAAGDKLAARGAQQALERESVRAGTSAEQVLDKAGLSAGRGATGFLEDKAAEQAFKSVLPSASLSAGELQRLGRTAEEQADRANRMGRKFLDEGIVTAGASKKDIAERMEAALGKATDKLTELRKPLDTSTVRPNMENIENRFKNEVILPLAKKAFGDKEAAPAIEAYERIMGQAGDKPTFQRLHELRLDLDEHLEKAYARLPGSPIPPGEGATKGLRRIIEDEYTRAGEEAAKELGGSFEQEYRVAKENWADLKTGQKWITKAVARSEQNRAISLTDTIMAGGALASGHPLGLLAPLVNKGIREYGNQVAAHILDRSSKIQAIQHAADIFDGSVSKGVKSFLMGEKYATGTGQRTKVTSETVRQLREATRDPLAVGSKVSAALGDTAKYAPKTAQAASTTAMRIATYLQGALPKDPPPPGMTFGKQPKRPLSDAQLAKAQRTIDVVEDPRVVLDLLQEGRLTANHVAALKVVDPKAYQQIRTELLTHSADIQPKLTYQQQITYSVLFGVPLNATMEPKKIAQLQSVLAQGADPSSTGQAGESGAMSPKRPLTRSGSDRMASGTDRLEAPNDNGS